MALSIRLSVRKHVTVTRILLIVMLGCAAVSIHWAFQTKNECITLCTKDMFISEFEDHDAKLHTSLLSLASSTMPNHGIVEPSSTKRDDHKDKSHRIVVRTTTALTDQTSLKSRTVQMPVTVPGHSSPQLQPAVSVDDECILPLFCSSKFVQNCVTYDIIGQIPDNMRSLRMRPPRSRSVETSHMRQQSFKKVFDSRAWGHDWDLQHRGLNASGEYQFLLSATLLSHEQGDLVSVFFFVSRVKDSKCKDW